MALLTPILHGQTHGGIAQGVQIPAGRGPSVNPKLTEARDLYREPAAPQRGDPETSSAKIVNSQRSARLVRAFSIAAAT